jgi:hypothetical protein
MAAVTINGTIGLLQQTITWLYWMANKYLFVNDIFKLESIADLSKTPF